MAITNKNINEKDIEIINLENVPSQQKALPLNTQLNEQKAQHEKKIIVDKVISKDKAVVEEHKQKGNNFIS